MPPRLWFIKLVVMIGVIVNYLTEAGFSLSQPLWRAEHWLGTAVVLIGAVVSWLHFVLLKRTAGSLADPERLVTAGGLLSYIRHPMYLGDVILVLGFGYLTASWLGLGLTFLAVAVIFALAIQEDQDMATKFAGSFGLWQSRTKLIVPFLL